MRTQSSDASARYKLETVSRACCVLRIFENESDALSLAEIAERTGIEKTIVFRLVHTLEDEGFLRKLDRYRYCRTVRLPAKKRSRVGYAAQTATSSFAASVSTSLRWAAKESGIDLIEVDNQYSAVTAVRNAERFVAEKVDLVIEFQTYERVASTISKTLHKAGIPMIAVEIPHPGAVFYGTDNYRAGITAGRTLGKAAKAVWRGEVDEVILLTFEIAGSLVHLRVSGIETALRDFVPPGCHFHHMEARGEFSQAFGSVRKYLNSRPARRTLIAGVTDASVLGAVRAFEEAGRAEYCLAAGMGADSEARNELRAPGTRLVSSVAFFPEKYGDGLVQLALEMLQKHPVPPVVHTLMQSITPQNVDRFYPPDTELTLGAMRLR